MCVALVCSGGRVLVCALKGCRHNHIFYSFASLQFKKAVLVAANEVVCMIFGFFSLFVNCLPSDRYTAGLLSGKILVKVDSGGVSGTGEILVQLDTLATFEVLVKGA